MNKTFLISCDSGCDLTVADCEERGISVLRMSCTVGEKTIYDAPNGNTHEFYRALREGEVAKTAGIGIGEFLEYFRRLAATGQPMVHISIGGAISGTYQNALTARSMLAEEMPDAVLYVIDSSLASLGYGMLVLEAADLRDAGKSLEESVRILEQDKRTIHPIFTTDNLSYLCRGGRIQRGKCFIAKALDIRPVMNLDYAGHLQVVSKARGQRLTFEEIVRRLGEVSSSPQEQTLYISHGDAPAKAEAFADFITARLPFRQVVIREIGTIIGAHAGPDLVAAYCRGCDRAK